MLTAEALDDDRWMAGWRRRELARIEARGCCYLDYTGAAPAPASLIEADRDRLLGTLLGNPHSEHAASRAASADLASAREAILAFLHASPDEYTVILTANASAASRLVGESFAWNRTTPLVLTDDNHNSVQGLAAFAGPAGAPVHRVGLDASLRLAGADQALRCAARDGRGLFAFPAQSNFSGARHPLDLVHRAQAQGHAVLLDAAALLHAAPLDLALVRPEFVILSLYKVAGHPGGIGALVARRDALARLVRPWFAGGTVEWVSVGSRRHRLRDGAEAFEDGTPAFLGAGAVAPALALVRRDGGPRLARHLARLTGALLDGLAALRHTDGAPMVRRYGPATLEGRGATIAFNLLDAAGRALPFDAVESRAAAMGLALRGGCFCNPGAAEAAFDWPDGAAMRAFAALGDGFTVARLARRLVPYAVGALRLSAGLGSVHADVTRALDVLEEIGAENATPRPGRGRGARSGVGRD